MSDEATFTPEQQKSVDALVGKTRIEARERAQKEFDTELETSRREVERARLVKEQEYKQLSEQLTTRVKELEHYEEQVGKYFDLLEKTLNSEAEAIGKVAVEAVKSLPGSIAEKLDWLQKNKNLFDASQGDDIGSPGLKSRKPDKDKPSNFKFKGI